MELAFIKNKGVNLTYHNKFANLSEIIPWLYLSWFFVTILVHIIVNVCSYFLIKIIILQMQPNDSLDINHLIIVHHEPVVKYL